MFAPLLGAIRADIDRQVGWAKDEAGVRLAMRRSPKFSQARRRLLRSAQP
jgi:hypothetical protein